MHPGPRECRPHSRRCDCSSCARSCFAAPKIFSSSLCNAHPFKGNGVGLCHCSSCVRYRVVDLTFRPFDQRSITNNAPHLDPTGSLFGAGLRHNMEWLAWSMRKRMPLAGEPRGAPRCSYAPSFVRLLRETTKKGRREQSRTSTLQYPFDLAIVLKLHTARRIAASVNSQSATAAQAASRSPRTFGDRTVTMGAAPCFRTTLTSPAFSSCLSAR
jgi:hypothetical protein